MEAIKAIPTWRIIIPSGAIFLNGLMAEDNYSRIIYGVIFIKGKSKIINGMSTFYQYFNLK